jgi:DNA-binding transcriptional LysR family regulator
MELRQIRYFVAVAEQLHFGRAAHRLSIAQPSLSKQIKNLEQELRVQLFSRGTRRVALTEAGQAYLLEARTILNMVGAASLAAQRAHRGEAGRLSIGFFALSALDILPAVLEPFRRNFPDVMLQLCEMSNEEQARSVLGGSLDVGIVREPPVTGGLSRFRAFRDTLLIALPRTHRLAKCRIVRLNDLREEAFVIMPRNAGVAQYDRVIGACMEAGFTPKIVEEAFLVTTVVGLVAAGLGLAIVPSGAAHIHTRSVIFRPLSPSIVIETCVIWDSATVADKPTLRAFLDTARVVLEARKPSG